MKDFKLSEKILKHNLKKRRSITLALIVSFLITGGLGTTEEVILARDLRARNTVIPVQGNNAPTLGNSANGTDVVNIVNPDKNGISHNKFTDLSVGAGNGLIFNNSTEHGVSQIGGYVTKNPNLNSSATTILNEVSGNKVSNIDGTIEVFGKRADFILANENGINVNGATFINTNGVTLSTGKVLKDDSNINFDVQKGNVLLNGVGTSGDYFNVLARSIEIHNEISAIKGEKTPDITLIAGQNKIELKKGDFSNPIIKSSSNSKQDKYGIYATGLGAMYGRNIRLISTDQGLGVKHEGAIFSEGDIAIEANGNISVATLNAKKGVKLKGKDLETKGGIIKVAGKDQINSISAGNDIIFELEGNGTIRSAVQSTGGNIVISAKGLTLQDKTSARLISKNSITLKLSEKLDVQGVLIPTVSGVDSNKLVIVSNSDGSLQVKDIESGRVYSSEEITWVSTGIIGKDVEIFTKELVNKGIISADGKLTITAESLLNEKNALLKGSDLELIANSSFVNKGEIRENKKELNEIVDPNGKLKIEVLKGKFENYGNISAKDITITAQELINALNGKVIASDGNIILTTTVGELVNNGEILATKDLKLISANNLTNTGKLGADSILIQAVQGKFLNAGHITAVKDLVINVKELFNAGSSEEIEKYLGALYQYSEEELTKVENSISELNKKIAAEKDPAQLAELKATLSGLEEVKNKLNNLKDILSKTGMLGVLSGDNVKITTKESFENKGVVTSQKDLTLETGSVINSGVLQAGDNLLIEALGKIVNTQRITAGKKIIISGDSFVSNGNEERIKEYLELLQKLNSENLSAEELAELKAKIAAFSDLGVIEGETLAITTKTTLENNGIVITKGDVSLKSEDSIKNNGVMSVGKNLDVKGKSFSSKNLTIKENLSANISGDFNSYNLSVGGNVDITSSKLENSGKLETGGGLNLTGNFSNKSGATASVGKSLNINGGVNNSGELLVGEILKVANGSTLNNGNINVNGDINIGGSSLTNAGKLIANGKIVTDVSEDISNSGDLSSTDKISLKSKNFSNSGEVVGNGVSITVDNSFSNTNSIQSNSELSIFNLGNGITQSMKELKAKGNIDIEASSSDVSLAGKVQTENNLKVDSKSFTNTGELSAKNIDVKTGSLNNTGTLMTGESTRVSLDSSRQNLNSGFRSSFANSSANTVAGTMISNGDITLENVVGDINVKKFQTPGSITISTSGDIVNEGMIVGNKDVNLKATNVLNQEGTTIWAGQNLLIEALEKIYLKLNSLIMSKGDMSLKAKAIINDAGTISSGKDLSIKTDVLLNKSKVDIKYDVVGTENSKHTVRWDDTFNYHLDTTEVWVPVIENNSVVTDKATIEAAGNINITGDTGATTKVLNESGTIAAAKDITIKGDIQNNTSYKEVDVIELLKLIKVKLSWQTKLYLTNAHGNSGVSFEGSLYDALTQGYLGKGREAYYRALALNDNELLNKALSSVLGSDWKDKSKPISQDKWNLDANFKYYAANGNAQILAGGNFIHTDGSLVNNGGESGGNKSVNITIGENVVDGIEGNLGVNIANINDIKEVNGIKYPHDVELATGSITIDGVTITAETGNLAGTIAVSGTVNPITFIDVPTGENGLFKPVVGDPQPGEPLFETNIEFIDPNNFYGSDYFFKQLGYDKNKTSSVLGDAYYDYLLIKDMIQKGLGYVKDINAQDIQALINNAAKVSTALGLQLGKALTQEQINSLEHDIVWYVEVEVNGQKVLAPQLYLSKNSRIDIAQNQGNGGTSTIKAGGDFISDNTSFSNTNGNIDVAGNVIIKSSGNITNNSSGGMSGGISADKNIAVDATGNINMIGGSLKGDNVIVSGNDVNIESTLGIDEKGNQIISDKAGIEANNGIQVDATGNINIKGGSLTASGYEVRTNDTQEATTTQDVSQGNGNEVVENVEVVKDINYYKELFAKDSKDVIAGDAGSININAGGDVNIEDIYTVSSEYKHEYSDKGYSNESGSSALSNGTEVKGSNINISGKNVNIKGSDLSTNDVDEKIAEKSKSNTISISAEDNVTVEDSADVVHISSSGRTLDTVRGLLTSEYRSKDFNASLSHGSNINTNGDVYISAGHDATIKGSNINSNGSTNISAKHDVNIIDGRDEIKESTRKDVYQVFGGSSTKTSKEASLSKGSNITGDGDLNISAGNDIKVVGGKVEVKGEVNFDAGNNVTFEAGKNEIKEDVNAIGAGVFAIGEGGLGGAIYPVDGVSFKETWDALGMPGTVITTTNAKGQNFVSGTGAVILDAIVVLQAGVKIENYQTSKFATTWTESDISGKNISINARNGVDIGGGNFGAAGTLNVNSKYLKSTKYEDIIKEEKTGFNVYIKELFGAESSLVDAASKIAHSVEAGGDLNPAVGVAQGVGIASNLILTNLFGAGVQTMIGYEVEQSNGISTKENITNITAKNVNFTTEKDMSLNGVDISATDDVTLNAGGDIKITSAKEQSSKDAYSSQADLRFNQGAGVNMIYGAGVGGHLGLNARVDVNQDRVNNKTNSGIAAGGNLVVKTKGSLDIDGGHLSAEKDVNLEVGKDLNIKSDITTSSKNTYYATASARVGFDLTTNTIVKGDLAVAAGGGRTYNDQQKIDESGITSGGNFIAKVGGDVDLDAAKLGSETGKGSLEVGGDINLKSETIRTDAAGADIVVGVGQLGEMGVSGYISDTIKKQEKVNSAIGVDSVIVKGDVAIDGEKKDITDIPNDINNNREVQEDYFSKGGAFSGVAPVKKGYNAATSYKSGSYDVNP